MNTEAVRLKLIHWISQLDDEKLLKKIESLRGNQKHSCEDFSVDDQEAIKEGLTQLNEGQFVPYSEVKERIKSNLKQ